MGLCMRSRFLLSAIVSIAGIFRQNLFLPALFFALLLLPAPAQAASLFPYPFSYYGNNQEVGTVLTDFAQAEGYTASVSSGVTGKFSGKFQDVPPKTFLAGMQNAFDVRWYVLGRTLHFYTSRESRRIFISPRTGTARHLYDALKNSSVFSPQLPPSLGTAGDVISVSGPPEYLDSIRSAIAAFEASQTEQIVMRVFPLKHAWAEDITVSSMDKTVTVPGIASILRAMIMGSSISGTRVTQEKATVEKLGGKGLSALGNAESSAQKPQAAASPVSTGSISIMADPRVNAVLVSDASYRMPYYEQVIKDLDKPVELVEIHAAIVDIDTDFKRELGITFQGSGNTNKNGWGGGGTISGSTTSGTGIPSAGVIENAGMTLSTIYTHGSDFFLSRIQALEENNEARVLGRPSVLTVDNIQATLENTTTYYVEVQGYQAVDLYKVEAGTVLRVTPHIIRENGQTSIKLAVSVQDDQDNSSAAATTGGVPPIKQTKINTQAIVSAGQSLLIGGYYYEQKGEDENGIPLLMHIPVLGHLFKSQARQSKRMERLILITPRIVKLNDNNVPVQAEHPAFHRSATQADYEPRVPVQTRGAGCSKKSNASQVSPASESGMVQ